MFRKLIAALLLIVGIAGVGAGAWGIYTVETNDDFTMFLAMYGLADLAPKAEQPESVKKITEGFSELAGDAMNAIDDLAEKFLGRKVSDAANDATNGLTDLVDTQSLKFNICMYRTEILLIGVIVIEAGLLVLACGRKRA